MARVAQIDLNGAQMELHRVTTTGAGHNIAIVTGFRRVLAVFATWAEAPGAAGALYATWSGATVTVDNYGDCDKAVDVLVIGYI